MSSKAAGWIRSPLVALLLLGGCQKDINHHPVRIAVTSLVSLGDCGVQGNRSSGSPSATPDGRYVAFVTASTNLVSVPTGGVNQVYRRDLMTGTTILISVNDAGLAGDKDSDSPSISADGLRVAFRSAATNFSADSNLLFFPDIYVRDLSVTPPRTLLMTAAAGGGPNDGGAALNLGCFGPSLSADGKFVAFISDASNLILPATSGFEHAFRREIDATTMEQVDLQPDGSSAAVGAVLGGVSVSADGRYVAFDSNGTDLGGPPGFPVTSWVYLRDMSITVAAIELVSVSLDPSALDPFAAGSSFPSISADGRVVAFQSGIPNLVPDDPNGAVGDVFVRDLRDPLHPRTVLASRHSSGAGGSLVSQGAALAPDGRSVAFVSDANNLVDGDFNGAPDVFWHDLSTGKTVRVSVNTALQEAIGSASVGCSLTADGRFVFFNDQASNLVSGDLNGTTDVFLRGPLY